MCTHTEPGRLDSADPSLLAALEWIAGHRARAPRPRRSPGPARSEVADHNYDAEDWWFRCRFPGEPGTWQLRLNGIATLADVWVNGAHVARTENMFVRSSVPLAALNADNELVIRCEALTPALAARRPRPRWKTGQVEHQALRWFRTNLLGRIPGWARTPRTVGPWKPLEIIRADEEPLTAVLDAFVIASCDGDGGRVDAALRFATLPAWAEDGRGACSSAWAARRRSRWSVMTTA